VNAEKLEQHLGILGHTPQESFKKIVCKGARDTDVKVILTQDRGAAGLVAIFPALLYPEPVIG